MTPMAFSEQISDRIREALSEQKNVEEKYMFGGVCYMVNGKMCMGVVGDEMMCRINPAKEEEALSRKGCRPMDFTSRPMKGYVYVDEEGMKRKQDFNYWIDLCLEYNVIAKASKKRKPK
jgi:TfoX/Sxy family transcriptional regulator of competence genes